MNNKALFCNPQIVFTPLRDLPTRLIEAVNHSSNSAMALTKKKNKENEN